MDSLLLATHIVLWIAVLVLAALVYGLTRQIRVLANRIAPAGALAVNQILEPGATAPTAEVQTLNGDPITVGIPDSQGSGQLLFFVAPDCPICQSLLPVARSLAGADRNLELIFASDGEDAEAHADYVARHDLNPWPYIVSEDLGRAYGVSKLPYAVLIAPDASVAAFGIVNTREHLESLFEAHERKVTSLQAYLQQQDAEAEELFIDAAGRRD